MSDYWIANLICSILFVFFLLTLHAIVFRWLFIRPLTCLCPDQAFHRLLLNELRANDWAELCQYWSARASRLGWLGDCLCESSAPQALARAEAIGRAQDSYLQPLILICNLSTLFGLLGTVGAFLVSDDVNDVAFSTAFRTTALGILVSIPPALYMSLTHNTRAHFDKQFDQFVEFVNEFARVSRGVVAPPKPVQAKVTLPASIRADEPSTFMQQPNSQSAMQPVSHFTDDAAEPGYSPAPQGHSGQACQIEQLAMSVLGGEAS